MASWNNWNFFNQNVQSGLTEGQFINAGSILLAAGPPHLGLGGQALADGSNSIRNVVWPIGLVSQWGVQQGQAVVPVPEAGSYKRYTITGPSDGSLALGRSLYHGPSLMRAMYAYFRARLQGRPVMEALVDSDAENLLRNPHNEVSDVPGYENFWINLASSIFSQPVGLLIYIQDVNRESYGAVYLEQFHISSHSFSSGPGQMVAAESCQGPFTRARPVKLSTPIPLMSRQGSNSNRNDAGIITVAGTDRTTGSTSNQRLRVATSTNI